MLDLLNSIVSKPLAEKILVERFILLKGAPNPNFLNLIINKEKFCFRALNPNFLI